MQHVFPYYYMQSNKTGKLACHNKEVPQTNKQTNQHIATYWMSSNVTHAPALPPTEFSSWFNCYLLLPGILMGYQARARTLFTNCEWCSFGACVLGMRLIYARLRTADSNGECFDGWGHQTESGGKGVMQFPDDVLAAPLARVKEELHRT